MEDVARGTRIQSDSRRDLYWFPTIKLSRGKLAGVVEPKLLSFVSASYFSDYICHQQHVFVFSQCEKAIQNLVLNQENIEIVDLRLVSERNELIYAISKSYMVDAAHSTRLLLVELPARTWVYYGDLFNKMPTGCVDRTINDTYS